MNETLEKAEPGMCGSNMARGFCALMMQKIGNDHSWASERFD
jgi:hypothetical protein